tara:strand:- start:1630 stop:2070 length:441 start_codon:yes stop_codon:yes gene_type:complete
MWHKARLNPLMEKKFSELEEGVDYIDLDKRSFAERLPEIVEKEANKESADMPPIDVVIDTAKELLIEKAFEGPRWIVFADYENGTTYRNERWVVCESLEDALEEYRAALTTAYTAGISAVVRSTDYDYVSSTEFSQAKLFLTGTPE